MNFKGATVFVTGANRGIGRVLVDRLARLEVRRIYAAARKPEMLSSLASELIIPVKLDITDRVQVKAVAVQASDTTVLINNAGVLALGSLLDSPLEMIAHELETNYYGTLNMVRSFAPVIAGNGGGAIANVLTMVALASLPGMGGYSASKAAAFSLTQAIRSELRSKGINVYGIYPGAVDTDMLAGVEMPKTRPEEIAAAIIAGITSDQEDIFPDGMSQQLSQLWLQNPKQLEAQFGAMAL